MAFVDAAPSAPEPISLERKKTMKTISCFLFGTFLIATGAFAAAAASSPRAPRPELAYFQEVNRHGPPGDPQMLFLLMAEYANANRNREGAEFLSARLKEFDSRLKDPERSLYLSAIAVLRAGAASEIPLLRRTAWVRETIAMLDRAEKLSGGGIFVVRWISGVVRSQLPGSFHQKAKAAEDLQWCLANAAKAPDPGWLKPVHFRLAVLAKDDGDAAQAQKHLSLSGSSSLDRPVTLANFVEDATTGHAFSSKNVLEIAPGRIYQASGYDFAELYFVVSRDGRELIAIDAGTRPDSAKASYEAVRAFAPKLPGLTTILVTHSHWDHIGGHHYFRSLNPGPKFYARSNYGEQLAFQKQAPLPAPGLFFGSRFRAQEVDDFKPDETIAGRREFRIGGTRIVAIPIDGGETRDALLFYLPEEEVMFVGDMIMPYLGAPFLEEGSLRGLLDAIDVVGRENPRSLLHGHAVLTRLFPTPAVLASMKPHLVWLENRVREGIRRGETRAALQEANLIPPGLVAGNPAVHLPYLVMRENVINRVYDQIVGYWQPDFEEGVDYLSDADRGTLLVDYLGVTESRLTQAIERMIADGNYELATKALDWTRGRFPGSKSLADLERQVDFKLMEKYEGDNPFKYIVYWGRMSRAAAASSK